MRKQLISTLALLSSLLLFSCSGNSFMTEDWDLIINDYIDDEVNVVYEKVARLNLALAQTGQLADKAFTYTQAGFAGLVPEWSKNGDDGALLSDIYTAMGYVSMAQRMAFETEVLADKGHNLRMLARLVQTNLVFGAYPVAEKYIRELEKHHVSKSWAQDQRRFLAGDSAVDSDPYLSSLKKCIPAENFISGDTELSEALKSVIRTNPSHMQAVEYLGTMYLLDMDFDGFRSFLDEFYGTEALPVLPRSFSEAACMMSELEHGYWKEVGVSQDTYNRYREFTKRLGSGLSMDRFKGTYYYYVMRANAQ